MSTAIADFTRARQVKGVISITLLIMLTLGCAVTLISRYDEQIDKKATELQQKMDRFLTGLDVAGQATYAQSKDFYEEYLIELRSILVRAQSRPKNSITEQQLGFMIKNLRELRTMHEAGRLEKETINTTRDLFNAAWRSVITLELAKKRGE